MSSLPDPAPAAVHFLGASTSRPSPFWSRWLPRFTWLDDPDSPRWAPEGDPSLATRARDLPTPAA